MNIETDDTIEFTPSAMGKLVGQVESLRSHMLCDISEIGADPIANQYFLMALASLAIASSQLKLAQLAQSRGLAGK